MECEYLNKDILYVSEPLDQNIVRKNLCTRHRNILKQVIEVLTQISESRRCFVAGGFPAYILARTKEYIDINIYIEDEIDDRIIAKLLNILKSDISILEFLLSYGSLTSYKITVNNNIFDINFVGNFSNCISYEQFIIKNISHFDLEICKTVIYVNSHSVPLCIRFNQTKWILLSLDFASMRRIDKYLRRTSEKQRKLQPQKLSLLAFIAATQCNQHKTD